MALEELVKDEFSSARADYERVIADLARKYPHLLLEHWVLIMTQITSRYMENCVSRIHEKMT